MGCPAQDGGLPKDIKYYILHLAYSRSGGDDLRKRETLRRLILQSLECHCLHQGSVSGINQKIHKCQLFNDRQFSACKDENLDSNILRIISMRVFTQCR